MDTYPVGHVLIFKNETFKKEGYDTVTREESDVDFIRLKNAFRKRGFIVEQRNNKNAKVNLLQEILNREIGSISLHEFQFLLQALFISICIIFQFDINQSPSINYLIIRISYL